MGKFAQDSHLFFGKRHDVGRGGLLIRMFYLNLAWIRYKDPHGFSEGLVWANVGQF